MNIGFIGLGIMGAPMAEQLANAGHKLYTCLNSSPLPGNLQGKADVVNTLLRSPRSVTRLAKQALSHIINDSPAINQTVLGLQTEIQQVRP